MSMLLLQKPWLIPQLINFVQDRIMYLTFIIASTVAALTLLLLLVALWQCYKLVTALVATALPVQEEAHMPRPPLERPVQETGAPIHHGNTVLVQARIAAGANQHPGAQCVQAVQETQQAFQLQDALLQSVGGLGTAQESLYQRNLPAAMVAGLSLRI